MFQAPDLLKDIWRQPDTSTDAAIIPNLIAGYTSGRTVTKQNKSDQETADFAEAQGFPLGYKQPSFMDTFAKAFMGVEGQKAQADPRFQLQMTEARARMGESAVRMQGLFLHNQMQVYEQNNVLQDQQRMFELQKHVQDNPHYFGTNPVNPFRSKQYQLLFDKMTDNYNQSQATKTQSDFIKNFNKDLSILAEENPDAFAAISLKRPNVNTMPDPEMVAALSKARVQVADKKALAAKRQPASIALTDEIIKSEEDARTADKAGNTDLATKLRDRASLLREQTRGQEVVTGYDDQGRPIIRMGKGIGAATVGTQSQAQQKLLRYENTIELLNHLDSVLKPEHLGAMGVTGEWIMDRGLSQLVPELANKERIDARTALIAAREGLMKEISNDPRFSNLDREEISKALPSSGIFESLPDAQQRLASVRNLITNRGKVYAKGLGQKPPLWTLTADEIKGEYKKWQDTKGKEGIDKETALQALTRFH